MKPMTTIQFQLTVHVLLFMIAAEVVANPAVRVALVVGCALSALRLIIECILALCGVEENKE